MDLLTAYKLGFLFRLGMEYAINPRIAQKIKPDWSTIAKDADFKEGDHPRDKDGKFKSGSGSLGGSQSLEQAKKKFEELGEKDRRFALTATAEEKEYINNKIREHYSENEPTQKQIRALEVYKNQLSTLIEKLPSDTQAKNQTGIN